MGRPFHQWLVNYTFTINTEYSKLATSRRSTEPGGACLIVPGCLKQRFLKTGTHVFLMSRTPTQLPPYGSSLPQYRPLSTSPGFTQPSAVSAASGYYGMLSGFESTNEGIDVARNLGGPVLPSLIKTPNTSSHEPVRESHDTPSKGLLSHDTYSLSHDTPSKGFLSHDTPSREEEYELPLPSKEKPEKRVLKSDGEDSSDWSSSGDEEEGEKPPEDEGGSLVPSSHVTLISQWEWRAMNKDADSGR